MKIVFGQLLVTASTLLSGVVNADESAPQAYCRLYDPSRSINAVWPRATAYDAIQRTVDAATRQEITQRLPFSIHRNELGTHTLYLPQRNQRTLGVVHARSEAVQRGLIEVVWSLDPRLRVRDFAFQRCRDRRRSMIEAQEFKRQIIGKSLHELRRLLTNNGTKLADGDVTVPHAARGLAVSVIRSGIKTITVTQVSWREELSVIRAEFEAFPAFPAAARIERIPAPYESLLSGNLLLSQPPVIPRNLVLVFRAESASGKTLGHVIRTSIPPNPEAGSVPGNDGEKARLSADSKTSKELWWIVRNEAIHEIRANSEWPGQQLREEILRTKGRTIDDRTATGFADRLAAEVLQLSHHN